MTRYERNDEEVYAELVVFQRKMRKAKLSQKDLARLCRVDNSTVWRWRTGKIPVPGWVWTILDQRKRLVELSKSLLEQSDA